MIVSRIKITTIVAVPALVKKHFIFSLSERETTFEVSLMLRKFYPFHYIKESQNSEHKHCGKY